MERRTLFFLLALGTEPLEVIRRDFLLRTAEPLDCRWSIASALGLLHPHHLVSDPVSLML
jgi:hypothetical protein